MFERRPGLRRAFHLGITRHDIVARDMDDELRFHLEERIAYLEARGLAPEAARAEALRRVGADVHTTPHTLHRSAQRKERTMAWHRWLTDLRHDLGYAARGLARRPGFTTIAVLTLAIGIGANTAIFSAVRALLLRPLPFRDPAQLVAVNLTAPPKADRPVTQTVAGIPLGEPTEWSMTKFELYRDQQHSLSDVALWSERPATLTSGDAERVVGEEVSARYFATLGVHPTAGHDFDPAIDHGRGVARQVLISNALWKRRFNADPTIVGRMLEVDRQSHQVLGVMPEGFRGLSGRADVFVPITVRAADELSEPWSLEFSAVGRLKPGVSLSQAMQEAAALGTQIYDATPMRLEMSADARVGWSATVRSLDQLRVSPQLRRALVVLFGAVACVLLISCVNLANLLLGRASVRQREIAIRLSLGAGRARLVRFLLAESLVLSILGGVASVLVAWWGAHALSAVNPESALRAQNLAGLGVVSFESIRLDGPALLFTLLVALGVGISFGLVPALQATRSSMQAQLKTIDATTISGGRLRGVSTRRSLVVTEVALAVVLLSGAGLMLRSLSQLLRVDSGFDSAHVLTARLTVPGNSIARDSLPNFYAQLLTRLGALPGVATVALGDCPPLNGGCNGTLLQFPDRAPVPNDQAKEIGVHWVTPGWFAALRVPLKRGRLFTDADRLGSEKVVLVNEVAAKRYWPGEDPLGKRVAVFQGGFHTGATVVGVVGDVRFATIDSAAGPDTYLPYQQSPQSRMMIYLRTATAPEALIPQVRAVIKELSPAYPPYDVRTLEERVAAASSQARLSATLLAMFAAIALALAVIGIYGVMSFAVSQRSREIGIRMALGADRASVVRLVIGEGMGLAMAGAMIGIALALGLSRLITTMLYAVSPSDPRSYAVITAMLLGAAVLATWIPARRASRVDPTEALRAS